MLILAAAVAVSLFLATVARPAVGAYAFLLLSPLVAGIARGELLPAVRPNELLLLLVAAALLCRMVLLMLQGRPLRAPVSRIDVLLILLATAASVLPLALLHARGQPVTADDLFYALVLWKYYLLYRIIRAAADTPRAVATCCRLVLLSACVTATVGILQVADLFGVAGFLHRHYDQPFEGHTGILTERATSTVGSAFGFADVMIMSFALAVILLVRGRERPLVALPAAGLCLAGGIAAGSFSGYIGLAVAMAALSILTGRALRLLLPMAAAALVFAAALWPVVSGRLAGFSRSDGVPHSWTGRWENLQRFFLPELTSGFNWLLGVRPAPRLPATESWRDWIYIESGYVWLLWIGGLPLLAAFIAFALGAGSSLWATARARNDSVGAAAAAGFVALCVITVLMLFDPHLTVRGAADLFFPLLALAMADAQGASRKAIRRESWPGALAPAAGTFQRRPYRESG
ncbi:MAG TPA: hypothetical protein VED40_03430 [Azospirillaceae bacterium]|nr:hypothetical protein [Azospirillaceae bacterium]